MIADNDFTLYTDGGFLLTTLHQPAAAGQFWDRFNDQLTEQTSGQTTASLVANGRVLRVLVTENGRPFAYHYGVYPTLRSGGLDIRVQPLVAWSYRMGDQDETVPMAASDSAQRLPGLKTKLRTAAAAATMDS